MDDRDRSSVAFLRTGNTEGSGKYLICVCNFTPVTYEGFVIGLPMPGKIRELLSSDDVKFGGSGLHNLKTIHSVRESFLDMDYSAKLTLPGMSAVYFSYEPQNK